MTEPALDAHGSKCTACCPTTKAKSRGITAADAGHTCHQTMKQTTLYTAEKIAIAELPEYLRRHKLRVTKVDLWQRKGLMVWTEDDDAEHATTSVAAAEIFPEQGGLGGTVLQVPETSQLQLVLAAEVS